MYHPIAVSTQASPSAGQNRTDTELRTPGFAQSIPVFSRCLGSWRIAVERQILSTPELAQQYDLAAPGWGHTLNRLGIPHAYKSLLRRIFTEQPFDAKGEKPSILDCGVGTGALSDALAHVLPNPFDLEGIDISPRMLEHANRLLIHEHMNLTLRQADVRALPYADGVFDMVMSAHVLEHLADPGVALKDMVRVVKPGGLVIVCLTQRSLLGKFVELKWRTHSVTPTEGRGWLENSGLKNCQCLSFGDSMLCRRLSVVCAGRKPSSRS